MSTRMEPYADEHVPVLCERIVELLSPALSHEGAIYVDGTLGLGGHAKAILRANPNARLIGLDRDTDAIEVARQRLEEFADRCTFVHCVYDEFAEVMAGLGVIEVHAVLLDLGLSSLQIDRRERGFAYSVDAPLDMRMNTEQELDACQVLNTYSERELARIIARYGEDKFAGRIARSIVAARENDPFNTSARLVQIISDAIPVAARHSGGHPAKRTFQALRIEVNAELEALDAVLPMAVDHLAPGGRIAVLAYHSLEDRLVKHEFANRSTDKAPKSMPIVPPELRAQARLLTRGAERPSAAESQANPRASSARLRVLERIEAVS